MTGAAVEIGATVGMGSMTGGSRPTTGSSSFSSSSSSSFSFSFSFASSSLFGIPMSAFKVALWSLDLRFS